MSDTIINIHPTAAAAVRQRLGTAEGDPTESWKVASLVLPAIATFRSRLESDREAALGTGPRWPGYGDDERVPLGITQEAQDELNRFLSHDWEATGIGFSEFIRRALADSGM